MVSSSMAGPVARLSPAATWGVAAGPPVSDCFLGAADTGAKRRAKSGFGARRPSAAKHDRLQSVSYGRLCRHSLLHTG